MTLVLKNSGVVNGGVEIVDRQGQAIPVVQPRGSDNLVFPQSGPVAVEQFPFLHHPESERIKILRFAAGGLVVIGPVFPDQAVQKPEAGPRRRGYRRVAGMPVIFGQTG